MASRRLGPYLLGPNDTPENGIYTGDCLTLMQEIASETIDVIATDPPYGVSRKRKGETYMVGDTVNLFPYFMPVLHRILKPDGAVYIFCPCSRLVDILPVFQTYFKLHSMLIWDKGNGIIPHHLSHYKLRHTPILYGSKGLHRLRTYKDDVIPVPIVRGKKRVHPTQKPVALLSYLIDNSAVPESVILDPFMGSGTTAVAAMGIGTGYLGFEVDALVAETARERVRMAKPRLLIPETEQLDMAVL